MDSSRCVILVAILEGRNFPAGEGDDAIVYVEARLNDQVLTTDRTAVSSLGSPHFYTELAWDLDRKSLHLFRIERKPIKLQCFVEYNEEKHLVGYSVLDIRVAQKTDEPKFEWKPLLNSKYKGLAAKRPELLLALKLRQSDEDSEEETKSSDVAIAVNGAAKETIPSLPELAHDIRVKMKDGYYIIWDSNTSSEFECTLKWTVAVSIVAAECLYKLVKLPAKLLEQPKFYFQYTFLGNPIITKYFTDLRSCNFIPEKVWFKIAADSYATLNAYFEIHSSIDIQLYDTREELLGFVSININDLLKLESENMEGQYKLLANDDSINSEEPCPKVTVSIETKQEDKGSKRHNGPFRKHSPNCKPQDASQDLHHYCFCIDLRSIGLIDETKYNFRSLFVQFSYAFFGCVDKIKTWPHIELASSTNTVSFQRGFCAFNFLTIEVQLMTAFKDIPLILEVINEEKVKTIVGTASVDLNMILKILPDDDGKKIHSAFLPVVNGDDEVVAKIHVISSLQDFGPSNLTDAQLNKEQESFCLGYTRDENNAGLLAQDIDELLVEAAIEIKLWKEKQITKIKSDLLQKEAVYLSTLENEIKNHGRNRNFDIQQKMEELKELEAKLRSAFTDIEARETHLDLKEEELNKERREVKIKADTISNEISNSIDEMKENYERKLECEKVKMKSMEAEKERLQLRIYSLEHKLKDKEIKMKDLEEQLRYKSKPAPASANNLKNGNTKKCSLPKNGSVKKVDEGPKTSSQKLRSQDEITKESAVYQLKMERDDLIKSGLCTEFDSIVQEIDAHLQKYIIPEEI